MDTLTKTQLYFDEIIDEKNKRIKELEQALRLSANLIAEWENIGYLNYGKNNKCDKGCQRLHLLFDELIPEIPA